MSMSDEPRAAAGGMGPGPREPIFNIPGVVIGLICAFVAVHLARLGLSFEDDLAILREFAVVAAPVAVEFGWFDQRRIVQALTEGASAVRAGEQMAVARYFLDGGGPRWWSLVTYGALHGGTAHVAMNCLWLAVFGSPVARRLGVIAFGALIIAGIVAGALLHVWMHAVDVVPLVGASAGVSAATGAAARFVFSRGLQFGAVKTPQAARALPALSLVGMVRNRAALVFVLVWFASNWLFGAGVPAFGTAESSIAWEAHVGGFVAGLALFPLLDRHGARG
jgi:membrane associated rhomboid family serine protease